MAVDALLGDLREAADGGFDGWCWRPARPNERVVVDLLVDDALAGSMVAAIFRRDLLTQGFGDGRHGFSLRLSPHNEVAGEHLVTARDRRSGVVFGRLLREVPGVATPTVAAVQRVEQGTQALWEGLRAARAAHDGPLPSERLRAAFAELGEVLATRNAGWRRPAPWRVLVLPDPLKPGFSVVLLATDAAATWRRAAALVPALGAMAADLIVVDPGTDPAAVLLPGCLRNLRYLRAPECGHAAAALALAAEHSAARCLLLVGDALAEPSAAGLLALVHVAAAAPPAVWLGADAIEGMAALGAAPRRATRLPGRLGLLVGIDRALLQAVGMPDAALAGGGGLAWADLAFKARLLGAPVHGVGEPLPADPDADAASRVPLPATAMRHASAAFHRRWGSPAGIARDAIVLDRATGGA